ncbi:protein Lines homolog 1 [Ictalurus punctatus]|uniref:Protein Lines n=1 Tax=Ictalurus punctatus TaxID=7998 RepID=W5U7V2_ICTPU|nr:protein Lines homolog 1 [Ictalurus punctatus]
MNMDSQHSDLQAVFTDLRSGVVPAMSTEELASQISSAINCSLHILLQSPHSMTSEDTEMTGMFLTLTGKIISTLSSKSLPGDVHVFYDEAMKKLFGASNLTADLVCLMNCQDRMLSHLAAKCMASFVMYDINNSIGSDPVWKTAFTETFQSSAPNCALDTHLWALTEVIKRILKLDCVNKREILMKLLADFESSLTSLYPKLLFQDSPQHTHAAENDRDSVDLELSVCALLDLVEVLSAARRWHGLCSSIQRLAFLQTSALLHLTLSNMKEFVKKRALLLLKRILVQRAGEEWGFGDNHSNECDEEYCTDLLVMADAVLQEVEAGWLRKFHVKTQASFFGGNKVNVSDGEMKDAVMLRAVSLILIKCLEIKARHVSTQGAQRAFDVQSCLMELLAFLQQQVLQVKAVTHPCSWILVVFADQDDDLIESAKVLITLYLHQRSLSSSDSAACEWGCNPHCHFTLLLRSLSFDHTVLLDFLISDETCFLEYCVLYLKHLRDHWQDFCNACSCIENSTTETHTLSLPHFSEASVKSQLHYDPQFKVVGFRQSLVDYENSDDSEDEDKRLSNLQMSRNDEEPVAEIDMRKAGAQAVSASADTMEKISTASTEGLRGKVVLCLAELRIVISRLHSKGLFPYNPSCLLKLLLAIETKGQLENPTALQLK